MSSPSSSGSGKRKRAASQLKSIKNSTTAELLQPSSRDASGEDADDSQSTATSGKHKKSSNSIDASNPPSKRPRTRTQINTQESSADEGVRLPNANHQDVGEPSDTTEASADIASRSKLKKTTSMKDAERKAMPPPEKGGIVNPAGGYITNPPPTGRPVRVYADGVFDLFHLGHMRQLEQAKTAFPNTHLIVGVTGDEETHKRKGLTVLSGAERAETIRHCKWVDEVIPNCPWVLTTKFLDENKIDYVAHDDLPYGADEGDDIYKPIKEQGKFLVTQRTDGVSTTGIITKIVRDYEKYISRQLKRGTSRQELNISWLKKNEIDLKRHVNELRDQIRSNWQLAGLEVSKDVRTFWQHSRSNSPARGLRSPSEADLQAAAQGPKSPSLFSRLGHLDIPHGERAPSNDFATGYSLGLIGGVRSWMTKSKVRESQPPSPSGSEADSEDARSPSDKPATRGRRQRTSANGGDAMET